MTVTSTWQVEFLDASTTTDLTSNVLGFSIHQNVQIGRFATFGGYMHLDNTGNLFTPSGGGTYQAFTWFNKIVRITCDINDGSTTSTADVAYMVVTDMAFKDDGNVLGDNLDARFTGAVRLDEFGWFKIDCVNSNCDWPSRSARNGGECRVRVNTSLPETLRRLEMSTSSERAFSSRAGGEPSEDVSTQTPSIAKRACPCRRAWSLPTWLPTRIGPNTTKATSSSCVLVLKVTSRGSSFGLDHCLREHACMSISYVVGGARPSPSLERSGVPIPKLTVATFENSTLYGV